MIWLGWPGRLGRRARGGGQRRPMRSGRARTPGQRLRRPSLRVVAIVAASAALLAGGWLWLRDSSLVAVKHVTVTGVQGPDAARIRSVLATAARNMTTLDVRTNELNTAVAPFPAVKTLRVSAEFPHGMRIRVIEQVPIGAVAFDGRSLPVAGDGTLLHDVPASPSLPTIPLRVPPGGSHLTSSDGLSAVDVLAAAPNQIAPRITQVTTTTAHGLVAQLRSGPSIYFGGSGRLEAKWLAADAVLADSGSAGASYIDVSDPERPAAGAASGSSVGSAPSGASATSGVAEVGTTASASGSASSGGLSSTAVGG